MASHAPITIPSSMHEDYDDEEDDDHHHHPMSRLSVCISNRKHSSYSYNDRDVVVGDDELEEEDAMINMSRLSVDDGSDIAADAELSDDGLDKEKSAKAGWSSLPATPQRRRLPGCGGVQGQAKEYASEPDVGGPRRRGWRRQRVVRERWLERAWEMRKYRAMDEEIECGDGKCLVVARSKGGGRYLSMDLEEVKACRDLGFQLQNDWTLEIPSGISGSIDTDSGGNSPIANWRISSPGDDPRDVKARLKVWAQAVALASASRLSA
ncbi:hypothetical protein ACLOJK_015791 [Asimina triloba]